MGEKIGRRRLASLGHATDDLAETPCVPIDDDGGQEIEAGNSMLLPLGGAVTDFAAPVEADGALQRMVRLALVQAHLGPALQVAIAQPVEHE